MDDVRKLVRVKPLFWDAPDKTAWLGSGVSPCEYYIRFENGSWWMPGDDEESAEAFLSDEAAKAAAQADYEARILAALTPAPSLAAAKAEGMREAQLDAALAALDESGRKRGETQALLDRAVEALEWALDAWGSHNRYGDPMQGDWAPDARATLAAIREAQDNGRA